MKKLVLAAAAALALTIAAPVLGGVATDAQARTVVKKTVVIKHGGRHMGRHMGRHHHARKVVIIKKRGHHHHHGATVIKRTIVR